MSNVSPYSVSVTFCINNNPFCFKTELCVLFKRNVNGINPTCCTLTQLKPGAAMTELVYMPAITTTSQMTVTARHHNVKEASQSQEC